MKKILLLLIFPCIAYSQETPRFPRNPNQQNGINELRKGAEVTPPKLVVGIVVDQMRADYIKRFWNKFGPGGFKRLVNEGFVCRNTNYNYVPTYTGPGHACVYTGATPSINGIAGNNWFDIKENKAVYCSEDKTVQPIGGIEKAGQMSPRNLLTTTIGDELRLSNNMKSKVIGIALKDRGAILPAGHTANAAYWFDDSNGSWITSSYYMNALPQWVNNFNKKELPKKYLQQKWETLLSIDKYTESLPDDNKYETILNGKTTSTFPYDLNISFKKNGYSTIRSTPYGNSLTKDFAIETIKSENLGKGQETDLLAISFSSTDYVGHNFGPRSVEVEDTYLRLDKDIEELLTFLDSQIGKNNVLIFLTADHAAAEVPSHMLDIKIPAGYVDDKALVDSTKAFLKRNFADNLYSYYENQQIYLNQKIINENKLDATIIQIKLADYLLHFNGVSSTLTSSDLRRNEYANGMNHLIQNGYNTQRSGDVIICFLPGWMEYEKTGTTHGSGYSYDTHVPLIWYGWNIKKGISNEEYSVTDIAPTVTTFLNILAPNGSTGKPIQGMLRALNPNLKLNENGEKK